MVDGLGFFLSGILAWISKASPLVSREKEKFELMVRENLNAKPWLFSAWQKSRHLLAKSVSPTAAILSSSEICFIWRDQINRTSFHFSVKK